MNGMNIKIIVIIMLFFILALAFKTTAYANIVESSSYLGHNGLEYIDDSYDVRDNDRVIYETISHDYRAWDISPSNKRNGIVLRFVNGRFDDDFCNSKMKVPDRFINKEYGTLNVIEIKKACAFKAFDLNPENAYMKLVDNVVFSKDGEILMSYAQYDDRTVYEIPDGTKNIAYAALYGSDNLVRIIVPDSVTELSETCFWGCENLKEVIFSENSKLKRIGNRVFEFSPVTELTLPSFEVQISNTAFGRCQTDIENLKLKSYVKPQVAAITSQGSYKLTWDKIPKASRYEIYQKKNDGSYKLLKETTCTSIKLNNIKSGKNYTFAVKPIAEIKAVNDKEFGEDIEYYTIEGTLSDDVTVIG